MTLLDEAMVAVVSEQISPIAAGTVYCSMISICQEMAELRRAQEWTGALDVWCGKQGDMLAYSGPCLVHRAELLQLQGQWPEAVEEAERACERLAGSRDAVTTGAARYRQAEIHRVCGDYPAAEQAYRQASDWGHDPCPGLALLRLARGDSRAAQAAMRRALAETTEVARTRALIALACREIGDGDTAALELEAAGRLFARLGAQPDLARVAALRGQPAQTHNLTERELQVLRLVATGMTNHAVAADLRLSGKTVERHLSNAFAKLGVSSRAAATAYAYQHQLL